MVDFDRSVFIAKFQEEASDLLQRLNEGVIALEAGPSDRALIDRWLRDAHTLKGSSRMVGLIEISDIAHRMEDIMVRVRDGEVSYTPAMSDGVFEALDTVMYLSERAGTGTPGDVDTHGLLQRLTAIASSGGGSPEGIAHGGSPAGSAVAADWSNDCGEERSTLCCACPASASRSHDGSSASAGGSPDEVFSPKAPATVRVRTAQVDRLLNLVGEVVISQTKAEPRVHAMKGAAGTVVEAQQTWSRLKAALATLPDRERAGMQADVERLDGLLAAGRRSLLGLVKEYGDSGSRTTAVVMELQGQAMELRMLPVSTVFTVFPRAMREMARQYDKSVELIIEGGETELDKKVLEEINDPLVHIMRNAVDHGIEPSADRVASGKQPQGTIRLSACQEGDHIVIEVSDDGAGIDPLKVKAAAVRKGYITDAEAARMSDREARYLIFEKGFSTAAIITELSGRGIGMDVVREFVVERLKGTLDLASETGKGTRFTLKIPLTLAIIRALLLRSGGQTFALPTSSLEEAIRIERSSIVRSGGRDAMRRGRRSIPLVPLHEILGIESTADPAGPGIAVASIGSSGHRLGVVVDEFLDEQQIVIKTLGSHLRRVPNIAGVTVLGAGEVVPILNVPDLMENGRQLTGDLRGRASQQSQERARSRRILICEDSFTTRELERSIFEAAGYHVETAVDGAAGLLRLREGLDPDAVVTDVQMPNMTGFELTRAMRADRALAAIPVVIVTSLEREEEKIEGINAGADAYITKSVFNQDTLLETVDRLVR